MKLWLDDIRPAPEGYVWCKSVSHAKILIEKAEDSIQGAVKTIQSYEDNYERCTVCQKSYYEKSIKPIMLNRIADNTIEILDLDHNLGDYAEFGGDGIHLLYWLEETGRDYPIHVHSTNAISIVHMRRIIERNGWKEIK